MSTTSDPISMDGSDVATAAIDAAWCEEIERRVNDIRTGRVQMLDMDEAHAQIRAHLAARRQQ